MDAPITRWSIEATVHTDRKNLFAFNGVGGGHHVGTITSGSKNKLDRFDADCRLIASAFDHALICGAMCIQDARWEEWVPFDGKGEFVFAGLKYATSLDEFGSPRLTPALREAIVTARLSSAQLAEAAA